MDRAAVFVDAGYLFAQGSVLLAGTKLKRSETRLDYQKVADFFEKLSATLTGLPLLRIYWYDGTDSGPTATHIGLGLRANVKVRLGIVNAQGQQKGVDSLIVSDLINLSRNRAMASVVLVTGDEDIRVGVQQAQDFGVRVYVAGIEPSATNQSMLLRQEADALHEVSKADVQTFLSCAPTPPGVVPAATAAAAVASAAAGAPNPLVVVAEQLAAGLPKADRERVANSGPGVPPDLDRQLLFAASGGASGTLTEPQKRQLRAAFIAACKRP